MSAKSINLVDLGCHFPCATSAKNPRSMYRACAAGDGAICSKNRKIVPYHGANPTRNGALTVSVPDNGSYIFRTFYQRKLWFSFLYWEAKCGDNIHHTVLSSATRVESPKFLASDRVSFSDSFSPIGQVVFTSPSLFASILVFF